MAAQVTEMISEAVECEMQFAATCSVRVSQA